MQVSASILRLTWAAIEETSINNLLTLGDAELIRLILQHVAGQIWLSGEEHCSLSGYLSLKLPLIRDTAESRLNQETRWLERNTVTRQPYRFAS